MREIRAKGPECPTLYHYKQKACILDSDLTEGCTGEMAVINAEGKDGLAATILPHHRTVTTKAGPQLQTIIEQGLVSPRPCGL